MSANYESSALIESKFSPGVSFRVARMSFARRLDLVRGVRELARKMEFLESGANAGEKVEAAILAAEIEHLYLKWGLLEVQGLELDGAPATPQLLAEIGPEELCREAVNAIKTECGLTDQERKN